MDRMRCLFFIVCFCGWTFASGQGWTAKITVSLYGADSQPLASISTLHVDFSGSFFYIENTPNHQTIWLTGDGDITGELGITASAPPLEEGYPVVTLNAGGLTFNTTCVDLPFEGFSGSDVILGTITIYNQVDISAPNPIADCMSQSVSLTADDCNYGSVLWRISQGATNVFVQAPGFDEQINITPALLTGMGFTTPYGPFLVTAETAEGTRSLPVNIRINVPSPSIGPSKIDPPCPGSVGSIQISITPASEAITSFAVSIFPESEGAALSQLDIASRNHSFEGLPAGDYWVTVENKTSTGDYGNCATNRIPTPILVSPLPIIVTLTPTQPTCHGYNNGSIQAVVQNAIGTLEYAWVGGGTGDNPRTGLSAHNYSLTVTDSKGCTGTNDTTISQPDLLTVYVTSPMFGGGSYNLQCHNSTNGTINTSSAGGTAPVNFYWSSGHNSATLTNVGAGPYEVTAIDAHGCQAYDNIQLTAPPPIDFSITVANAVTCPGASTGSLTLGNVTNSVGLLTYSWSSGETTPSISSKPAGQYSLTITDAGGTGCSATRQQTLTDPPPFTVEITPQSNFNGSYISCDGEADGILAATLKNNFGNSVPAQNYQWFRNSNPYGGSTGTLSFLDAGSYRVDATYGSGCVAQSTFALNDPAPVSAQISTTSNYHGFAISCPGASDGALLAVGQGGTPGGYTFEWEDGPASANISGVDAGTYFVNVTDINGCVGSAQYNLNEPLPIIPSIGISSNYHGQALSCANASDGILNASAMNGAAPVQFTWSNGFIGNVANNLAAGTYSLVATDANGCAVQSQSIDITNPAPVVASISILSNYNGQAIQCHDGSNGILQASGEGGTNNYSYAWSNLQTSREINGLPHGVYSVTVSDQNSCQDSEVIELINPTQVNAAIKSQSNFTGFGVQCHGLSNGFIEVEAQGGTNEFLFSWLTLGETTARVENLSAGIYEVVIQDSNGCSDQLSYEITEATELTVELSSATDITCFDGSDGVVVASAHEGVGQLQFSLDNLSWQDSPEFHDLLAADYVVTVRDANQCEASFDHTVTQPEEITVEFIVLPAVCADPVGAVDAIASGGVGTFSYEWRDPESVIIGNSSGITQQYAGIYRVSVRDERECLVEVPIGIPSLDGPKLVISENLPTTCATSVDGSAVVEVSEGNGPFSILWDNGSETWSRSDLSGGTHYLSVRDVNDCLAVTSVETISPEEVTFQLINKVDPSCFLYCDGKIEVEAFGGNGDYTFEWNNSPGERLNTTLCAGTHEVSATDKLGCSASVNVTLHSPQPLQVRAASRTLPKCFDSCDGAIEAVASGGDSNYSYTWNAGSQTPRQENICPGQYEVTVHDGKGCERVGMFSLGNTTKVEANLVHLQSPVCHSDCNGILEVVAKGGAGEYTYSWSDGVTESKNSSLCAGVHQVLITDKNNCTVTESYQVPDVPQLSIELGDGVVLCEGQQHRLSVDESWQQVIWKQDNTIVSSARSIILTEPGEFGVEVRDAKNCKATDTFILEYSNDLLEASFIVADQAVVGDTIAIIDISWPLPETITWEFPEEMLKLHDLNEVVYGKFEDAGVYDLTLHASLGLCRDEITKTITILDNNSSIEGGRLGAEEFVKSLTLHPNPNSGTFEVEVEFIEKSPISIFIWNMVNSKLVSQQHDQDNFHYKKQFNLSPISSGMYLMKIQFEGGYRTLRFMIH